VLGLEDWLHRFVGPARATCTPLSGRGDGDSNHIFHIFCGAVSRVGLALFQPRERTSPFSSPCYGNPSEAARADSQLPSLLSLLAQLDGSPLSYPRNRLSSKTTGFSGSGHATLVLSGFSPQGNEPPNSSTVANGKMA